MENTLNLIAYNTSPGVIGWEGADKVCKLLGLDYNNLHCCICGRHLEYLDVGMFVKYKGNNCSICSDMECVALFLARERPDLIGGKD